MLTCISEYPMVWDRGKAATFFSRFISPRAFCVLGKSLRQLTVCEINAGVYFFLILYTFSILIFATAFFQFGHFPLAHFIHVYGVCVLFFFFSFTSIGFIFSRIHSRQVAALKNHLPVLSFNCCTRAYDLTDQR